MTEYGYAGKILRVDLTTRKITEIASTDYLPKFIGGRGLAAKIYWDEIQPEVEALDPANRLIFAVGPLSGTGALAAGQTSCATKAPMIYPKSSYYSGSAGGRWGVELKYAGYDAIILQGKAEKHSYLWISDGHVEIRDADALWGLTTRRTREELMRVHGTKVQVACIGPAGENLVVPSVIVADCSTVWALGGHSAVMGSKNLKAIAVRGTGRIKVANPQKILEVNEKRRNLLSIKVGETKVVGDKTIVGAWQTRNIFNFLNMVPKPQIREEGEIGLVKIKQSGCPGCLLMCKSKVEFPDHSLPSGSAECGELFAWSAPELTYYGGEASGRVLWEFVMLVDALGLDACYLGTLPQFLGFPVQFTEKGPGGALLGGDMWFEAYKRGILTEENTGLPWTKFGSREFMRKLLRMVAYREGFGDILARGFGAATKYIAEHEEFGPNRGEMEYLYQKTCPNLGMGGFYRHCFSGGYGYNKMCPLKSFYSAVHAKRGKEPHAVIGGESSWLIKWMGTDKMKDYSYWGEDVALATMAMEHYSMENDSAPACTFNCWQMATFSLGTADEYLEISPCGTPEYWSAVFGEDVTQEDLMKRYEMLVNLERAIWVRDGYTEDTFHDCIFEEADPEGNKVIPKDKFKNLLEDYYRLRGWKAGVPTRAKLEELDLKDVADELASIGKLP